MKIYIRLTEKRLIFCGITDAFLRWPLLAHSVHARIIHDISVSRQSTGLPSVSPSDCPQQYTRTEYTCHTLWIQNTRPRIFIVNSPEQDRLLAFTPNSITEILVRPTISCKYHV